MPETQPKEQTARVIPMTVNDLISMQLQDLKEDFRGTRKELSERMERLERRQDRLEEKLETTRKEFNQRMDKQDEKKWQARHENW